MVEVPDSLRSLFTGTVKQEGGRYVVQIPENEIDNGAASPGQTYRIAILPQVDKRTGESDEGESEGLTAEDREPGPPAPPVDEGEIRTVSVESVGDQGDGIAKVERGYVVIVPEAKPGDEPTVEIEDVKQNVAFARIVE
ncbi:MAG: TRAM domain-containing protein [Halovenus sp.]